MIIISSIYGVCVCVCVCVRVRACVRACVCDFEIYNQFSSCSVNLKVM